MALHMCSIRCQRQCQPEPPDCKWRPISGKDEVTSERCSSIAITAITISKKSNVINVGTLHPRSELQFFFSYSNILQVLNKKPQLGSNCYPVSVTTQCARQGGHEDIQGIWRPRQDLNLHRFWGKILLDGKT